MRMIAWVLAICCVAAVPAPHPHPDFLLYRHHHRLALITASGAPGVEIPVPSRPHAWEGTSSRLSISTDHGTLTLIYSADVAATPWFINLELVQHRDGRVVLSGWGRGSLERHTSAYRSFADAYAAPGVAAFLGPALSAAGQSLPTRREMMDGLFGAPVPPPELRIRILSAVARLGSPDPRVRCDAYRSLIPHAAALDGLTRTMDLSIQQRKDIQSIIRSRQVHASGELALRIWARWGASGTGSRCANGKPMPPRRSPR